MPQLNLAFCTWLGKLAASRTFKIKPGVPTKGLHDRARNTQPPWRYGQRRGRRPAISQEHNPQ